MDWNEINSQNDIDRLFDIYGGFHDSCIVSMQYQSGTFVDAEMNMHYGTSSAHELLVVFNRQGTPKTLEMRFIGLRRLSLTGWQRNYSSDIFGAHLSFYNKPLPGEPGKAIVWASCEDFSIQDAGNAMREPPDTYIIAHALKWRIIEK